MTTKEMAIHSIEDLPDDADWSAIQERINFVAGVRKALRELDEGNGIPHDRVKEEAKGWPGNGRDSPLTESAPADVKAHQ